MYYESVEAKWLDPAKQRVQVDRQMKELMNHTRELRAECDHQRAEIRVLNEQMRKIDSMNLMGKVEELEKENSELHAELDKRDGTIKSLQLHMGKLKKRMADRGIEHADC